MFDLALECSGKTIFFFGGTYFILVTERKEVGRGGGDPHGNREQEQKHTETAPVSQCF